MLETTSENSIIAAGIDIGSNSVRMIIAQVCGDKILKVISSRRESSRLASMICNTKCIADGPFKKSLDILKKYKNEIDDLNVSKIKAVATSAVREAENGEDFIKACENIGINAEIISGHEEAKLCFKGVKAGIEIKDDMTLIFDTGGGSTEFIAVKNNKLIFNESYKIGVVKLTDMFPMKDNTSQNIAPCTKFISDFFENAPIPSTPSYLIGTAGTASSIAAIHMGLEIYDANKINGYSVTKTEIENILHNITSLPYEKRSDIKGLEKGREDLIIPGILIILEVMKKTHTDIFISSDYGLREGAVVVAANS